MPAPKTVASDTLTRREACGLLGKSARSLNDYTKAGRLPVQYASGPTGRQAVFARADVERLKRELETPLVRQGALALAPRLDTSHDVSTRFNPSQSVAADMAFIFERAREYAQHRAARPWLTLAEATKYSGLPRAYLRSLAVDGTAFARDVALGGSRARWMFSREGLAKL